MNTSAGTSFGDVARYSCDTGYTLNGPAERTCQADGRWNGSVPTCESEILEWCHSLCFLIAIVLYSCSCTCMKCMYNVSYVIINAYIIGVLFLQ